jgi:hypothetical protein
MPACKICGTVQATVEVRRCPDGRYVCKDKIGCKHDKKIRGEGGDPGPRSLQRLLRF